jgi:hypothetical protein
MERIGYQANTVSLLTFGDGIPELSWYYKEAAKRLASQALKSGWFHEIYVYDFEKLKHEVPEWCSLHQKFLFENRRGFGYWIWKFLIIYLVLKKIRYGDQLLYIDCGYELNVNGSKRFHEYTNAASIHSILAFEIEQPILKWTKNDLFRYFDMESYPLLSSSKQIQAGLQLIKKTPLTLDFYRNLSQLSTAEEYHLIDDSPSTTPNHESFQEHRHDQSLFTCLAKIYGIGFFPFYEDYWPDLWEKNLYRSDIPFQCLRNISGKSKLP